MSIEIRRDFLEIKNALGETVLSTDSAFMPVVDEFQYTIILPAFMVRVRMVSIYNPNNYAVLQSLERFFYNLTSAGLPQIYGTEEFHLLPMIRFAIDFNGIQGGLWHPLPGSLVYDTWRSRVRQIVGDQDFVGTSCINLAPQADGTVHLTVVRSLRTVQLDYQASNGIDGRVLSPHSTISDSERWAVMSNTETNFDIKIYVIRKPKPAGF